MKKFAILILILVYGGSYYLYDQEVKGATQNMFDNNMKHHVTVTGASFSPLAPLCMSDNAIITVESKGKTASVPVSVSGCPFTSGTYVQMNSAYALKLVLNGF